MKTLISCFIFLILIQAKSYGQNKSTRVKEIGINFSGSNLGVSYKTGNQSNLLRLTLLSLTGHSSLQKQSPDLSTKTSSQGFGFNIGMEKRKNITENVSFYCGFDLLTSYYREISKYGSSSSHSTNKNLSLSSGLGLIIGFNYSPISKIRVSAELMPSINYTYLRNTYNETEDSTGEFDYGLKNSGVNVTLSYILGK